MKKIIKLTAFIGFIIMGLFIITQNNEIRQLKHQEQTQLDFLDTLQIELDSLRFEIKDLLNKMDSLPIPINVKATMYHPVEAQCDDTPLITADGSKICPISVSDWNWIAVSQDLLWFNNGPIRYGDTVYVIAGHKTGYYIVHDAMNKRWTNRIDFLESIGVEAYRYNKAKLIINS